MILHKTERMIAQNLNNLAICHFGSVTLRNHPLKLGLSLGAMGLWVLGSTAYHIFADGVPTAEVMGVIGFLALAANLRSVLLLMKYRDGDANVRSVWLCSRNDAIGNVAVMVAASGVWLSQTAWPDLIVAAILAGLFFWSATQIVLQALREGRSTDSHLLVDKSFNDSTDH